MCYSFDVLKKMAFEKEIEHINCNYQNDDSDYVKHAKLYLADRVKEIDEKYGKEPQRD